MRLTASPSLWPGLVAGLGLLVLTGLVYVGLRAEQIELVRTVVVADAARIAREVDARHQAQVQGLRRLAVEAQQAGGPGWERTQEREYLRGEGFEGVYRFDADLAVLQSLEVDGAAPPNAGEREQLAEAARRGGPQDTAAYAQTDDGHYLYVPLWTENDTFDGVLAARYATESPFSAVVERNAGEDYRVTITAANGDAGVEPAERFGSAVERPVRIDDVGPGWVLVAAPRERLIARYRTWLPEIVLALGVLLGLLAAGTVRAWQWQRHDHERVRHLNAALQSKVADRTREYLRELSERERVAANLAHVARYDPLTGLPNRLHFDESLVDALFRAERQNGGVAVLAVDLDNFRDINHSLGREQGDALLVQVGDRISEVLHAGIVARHSEDEFLVLLPAPTDRDHAAEVGAAVLECLAPAFDLGGEPLRVSASIGITLVGGGEADGEALVEQAHTAMRQAKARGRNRYEFYAETMRIDISERMAVKSALATAIARHELSVHYQPRVELGSRCAVGAEALVRWYREGYGLIPPDVFVPMAEQSGLINQLGREVLELVCRDLQQWSNAGVPLPVISVNASALQFRDERLVEDVRACVAGRPDVARHPEIELTERVLLENQVEHRRVLRQLTELGLEIAIDDFGTGCSSFTYLRHFPVKVVKIDRSFIGGRAEGSIDAMITDTIVDLGRNFRMRVVAEGVETEFQYQRLRERGCHEGQGFLFGRAVPGPEFFAAWRRDLSVRSAAQ